MAKAKKQITFRQFADAMTKMANELPPDTMFTLCDSEYCSSNEIGIQVVNSCDGGGVAEIRIGHPFEIKTGQTRFFDQGTVPDANFFVLDGAKVREERYRGGTTASDRREIKARAQGDDARQRLVAALMSGIAKPSQQRQIR